MSLPEISKLEPSLTPCWSWPCLADLFLAWSWLCHITTDFPGHLGSWMMIGSCYWTCFPLLAQALRDCALAGEGNALPAFLSPWAPGSVSFVGLPHYCFSLTMGWWMNHFSFLLGNQLSLEADAILQNNSTCAAVILSGRRLLTVELWKQFTQPCCKALWDKENVNGLFHDMHVSYTSG